MVTKEYVLRVRVSKKEYELLCRKAKKDEETRHKNGTANLSAYLRKCAMEQSGQRVGFSKMEIRELSYQIRKVGVNINQIAHLYNSQSCRGVVPGDQLKTIQNYMNQILELFKKFIEKVENKDGNNETDEHQRTATREK